MKYSLLDEKILNEIKDLGFIITFEKDIPKKDDIKYIFKLSSCDYRLDCFKGRWTFGHENDFWESVILRNGEICCDIDLNYSTGYQTEEDILNSAKQLVRYLRKEGVLSPILQDLLDSGKSFKEINDYMRNDDVSITR